MIKYAKASILEVRRSPERVSEIDGTSFSKLALASPKVTEDGFLYVKVRAISSRVNKNNDGWPSEELAKAYKTFEGRPIFVDHNNDNPDRTRGVIVSSQLHVDDEKTATLDPYYSKAPDNHKPPTWIELLLEVDANSFPKLADAIVNKDIDAVSMGANIDESLCSVCENKAKNPAEYCDHINNKGIEFEIVSSDGERSRKLAYEDCYGINFFEISFVFDPADETALIHGVGDHTSKTSSGGVFDQDDLNDDPDEFNRVPEVEENPEQNQKPSEEESVISWRLEQLEKVGFPPGIASQLATMTSIDWHLLARMLGQGATPEQVEQIVSHLSEKYAEEQRHDELAIPGDFESDLDRHLVDYEGPGPDGSGRPLHGPDAKAIQDLIPGVQVTGYTETPFINDMHNLMGIDDPMNIDPYDSANRRKALFETQPKQTLPIHQLIFTQPNINWPAVQHLASDPSADPGNPYVVHHETGHYVMDGHHRTVADWLRGLREVPAHVLDLRTQAVPHDEVDKLQPPVSKRAGTTLGTLASLDYELEDEAEILKQADSVGGGGEFPLNDQSERTINYTPQSELETAPEEVDTLRADVRCPQCSSEMETDKTTGLDVCPECNYATPPDGFDNPDLSLHEKLDQRVDPATEGLAKLPDEQPAPVEQATDPNAAPPGAAQQSPITPVNPVNAISRNDSETVMSDMKFTVTHKYVESASSDNKVIITDESKKGTDEPEGTQIVSDQLKPVETHRALIDAVAAAIADGQFDHVLNKEAEMKKETDREVIKRVEEDGSGVKRTEEIVKEYGPMGDAENGGEEVVEGEESAAGDEVPAESESDDTSGGWGGDESSTPESETTTETPTDDDEDKPKWSSEQRLFAALKLAKLASEIGLITSADELLFVSEMEDETMEQIEARMDTLSRVKEAGLAKKPRALVARRASFPTFPKAAASSQVDDDTPFEAVFL